MLKRLGEKCLAFSDAMRMTLANLTLGGRSVTVQPKKLTGVALLENKR